jgi:hypothetical protein
MKILCKTQFDCTHTGVTGHFRPSEIPFRDQAGQTVTSQENWNYSRNQQRNWETLMQIFGLRTQPINVTRPVCANGTWEFEFINESENVFGQSGHTDCFAGLKNDCDGVPMIVNLKETLTAVPMLITSGNGQNIWFESINNTLD